MVRSMSNVVRLDRLAISRRTDGAQGSPALSTTRPPGTSYAARVLVDPLHPSTQEHVHRSAFGATWRVSNHLALRFVAQALM